MSSYSKPVFHGKNVFHRKNGPTEVLTPQHEEMIKYIEEGEKKYNRKHFVKVVVKKARVRNESDETKEKENLMNVIISFLSFLSFCFMSLRQV